MPIDQIPGRLIFASLLLANVLLAQGTPLTLEALLQQGVTAFSAGDYQSAAKAFSRLDADFSQEPEYKPLPRTLLPIWGYAEAQSGNGALAIELYERFLKDYPDERERQGFVLYALAQAYQTNNEPQKAIDTYQRFIERAPDAPEAVLSAMRQSDLYFELDQPEKGIERLAGFSESEKVPPSLQAQARLRAIQKAQEIGNDARAAELLLTRNWHINSMPELAVLAFCALKAGDYLMQEERPADAVRVLRLVPPHAQLITVQEQKLFGLQTAMAERARKASAGLQSDALWNDYYRNLIAQVQMGLEALKSQPDYTPSMQIRLGQAFLLLARNREAYLLYEQLAEDASLDSPTRSQAHYRWILAANALEDWDDSLRIALEFLERYPGNPLAPEALYLIANAYHAQKRYEDAIGVLDELLSNYPNNRLAPRWLFSRGFNKTLAEDFSGARVDFEAFLEKYPDHYQVVDARLWNALTYFFAKQYATALSQFDAALEATPPGHPRTPEILYRRASTLYSMRNYDAALPAIESFLKTHPEDMRAPEALVLRGDILMGQGRLLEAANAFYKVSPEAGPLYVYAIFQRGKILRALEEYDLMIEHFQSFIDREDVPEKVRVAEALYWIGWAQTQKGQQADAFPVFIEALERYGNDPLAGETGQILQALEDLHTRYRRGEEPLEASSSKAGALLTAESFDDFLREERQRATDEKALTWLARLNLYAAAREDKRKHADRAEGLRWEIVEKVPIEALDADGLAEIGLLLQSAGFGSAKDYFERLIEEYPARPATGAGYYGLALEAQKEGDLILAERWLKQFKEESPMHPLAPEVTLLRADILTQSGRTEEAVSVLEELLALKNARGRPHAKALLGIANAYESAREPEKAIAYYQRIYTVYRAYPELLAVAYPKSAKLFEEIGNPRAALETYREMLADKRLSSLDGYEEAQGEFERLSDLVPPEENPTNETSSGEIAL